MQKWINVTPDELQPGDHIRMLRKFYGAIPYEHHGIYISPEEVIQAAGPRFFTIKNLTYRGGGIVSGDLNYFVGNEGDYKFLQKRVYDKRESYYRNSPEHTIAIARAMVGCRNYDLIFQNCEHFANLCTFGKSTSKQTNRNLMAILGGHIGLTGLIALTRSIDNNLIRIPAIIAGTVAGAIVGGELGKAHTNREFYEDQDTALASNQYWRDRNIPEHIVGEYKDKKQPAPYKPFKQRTMWTTTNKGA